MLRSEGYASKSNRERQQPWASGASRGTLQLAAVAWAHLLNLARHSDLLAGIERREVIDIDSLLRPVYGHTK